MVFRSYDTLRKAGFDSINVDLMFAIPGQTMDVWKQTLDEALALGTEHLSCYEVIYEEDTPLFEQLKAGEIDVDEELACAQYDELIDRSASAGFRQYEVANFARDVRANAAGIGAGGLAGGPTSGPGMADVPAFACRHNVAYWMGHDFHGCGPSASEYVDGVRSRNWANTGMYCEQLERGRRAKEFAEALGPLARAGELAAFGLRMNAGWRYSEFQARTGFDLRQEWAEDLHALVGCGWGERSEDRFRLNRQGLRFADSAAVRMLRPEQVAEAAS
jgi:oxygen-independent coproporphyrinogen-3 oxidase